MIFFRSKVINLFILKRFVLLLMAINLISLCFSQFGGGQGTEDDPYQIETAVHLSNVKDSLGLSNSHLHFVQTADIDLDVEPWNEGSGWEPIGCLVLQFFGSYDGNGFVISNLFIDLTVLDTADEYYLGLFGYTNGGATVKNVTLENVSITGNREYGFAGGLIGYSRETVIDSCSVTNLYIDQCTRTGGLIGEQSGTSVSNCYVNGGLLQTYPSIFNTPVIGGLVAYKSSVITDADINYIRNSYAIITINTRGADYYGGLVGFNARGNIENSWASGSIIGNNYGGGLVGVMEHGDVLDSYAFVAVNGNEYVGGLIGSGWNSIVTNCFSTGTVQGNDNTGGMIGSGQFTVNDSYWDIDTSNQNDSEGGSSRNTDQMLDEENYDNWDFDNTWSIIDDISYPWLQWHDEYHYSIPGPRNLRATVTEGTILLKWDAPITVSDDIDVLGYNVYRNGELVNQTDLIENTEFEDSNLDNWVYYSYMVNAVIDADNTRHNTTYSYWRGPTVAFAGGTGTSNDPYLVETPTQLSKIPYAINAHFKQIDDIDLDVAPFNENEGWKPIGHIDDPFTGSFDGDGYGISNLFISTYHLGDNFGDNIGLFGYISRATLRNINLYHVDVQGFYYVGGLAGYVHDSSQIINCQVSAGNIDAYNTAGGLVGYVEGRYANLLIKECFTSVDVYSETSYAGGLAGYIDGFGGNQVARVDMCGANGDVKSVESHAGGLIGHFYVGTLTSSFAAGNVSSRALDTGGLVGHARDVNISNSYALGDVLGGNGYTGGLLGRLWDGRATNCYSAGKVNAVLDVNIGGLIGTNNNGTVNDSFWDIDNSGLADSDGGTGRTTSQMLEENNYDAWDLNNNWSIVDQFSYPYLQWQDSYSYNIPGPRNFIGSSGVFGIMLTWDEPPITETDPEGYNVYRDGQLINVDEYIENTEFNDTGLENWRIYDYSVTAVYQVGDVNIETGPSRFRGTSVFFAGGTGTQDDPYLVSTPEHLNGVRYVLDMHFEQTSDIDLDIEPYNSQEGWNPIGNKRTPFTGHYDGDGYKISNLYINRTDQENQGLFGYISEASLTDMHLKDTCISVWSSPRDSVPQPNWSTNFGMLIGYSTHSEITRSSVEGIIRGVPGTQHFGGLIGRAQYGNIINQCYASGKIEYTESIFLEEWGQWFHSYEPYSGGLVGYAYGNHNHGDTGLSIIDSYSVVALVGGRHRLGGLVSNYYNLNVEASLIRSYAAGPILPTIESGRSGGLAANISGTQVNLSYWDIETTGKTEGASNANIGTGLTREQMTRQLSFNNWDFNNVWNIEEGLTYPYLNWQDGIGYHNFPIPFNLTATPDPTEQVISLTWAAVDEPQSYNIYRDGEYVGSTDHPESFWIDDDVTIYTNYSYQVSAVYSIDDQNLETMQSIKIKSVLVLPFAGGNGTEGNPYQVSTVNHLVNLQYLVNRNYHYIQTADIDLNVEPWNTNQGWNTIGTIDEPFTGSYNGNGFSIANLYINRQGNVFFEDEFQGLFGYVKNSEFRNIKLVDVNITAMRCIGALIGRFWDDQVGTQITNCSSTGSIKTTYRGSSYMGGLVGEGRGESRQSRGLISESYSTVDISGGPTKGGYAGGIAGYNHFVRVESCWADSDIFVREFAGGLVGRTYGGDIINSYALGNVEVNTFYAGGLVSLSMYSNIRNSYAMGNVRGGTFFISGLISYFGPADYTVEECFAGGNVTSNIASSSSYGVAGLVGRNFNGVIKNSYALGNVTGNNQIGGLIGVNTGHVAFCYSTGRVTAASHEDRVGGLIAENTGEVESSYWDIQTSGQMESFGGIARSTNQMTYPYSMNTYEDWDFNHTWRHCRYGLLNDYYPVLHYQYYILDVPQVNVRKDVIDNNDVIYITWDPIEDANSYYIYASQEPSATDWGEPIDIVEETEYYEHLEPDTKRFYRIVATVDEIDGRGLGNDNQRKRSANQDNLRSSP